MKITKQRLKEIIKEELENSQNEGKWGDFASAMYGRAKAGIGVWKQILGWFKWY
jgi:hypothetical protein